MMHFFNLPVGMLYGMLNAVCLELADIASISFFFANSPGIICACYGVAVFNFYLPLAFILPFIIDVLSRSFMSALTSVVVTSVVVCANIAVKKMIAAAKKFRFSCCVF